MSYVLMKYRTYVFMKSNKHCREKLISIYKLHTESQGIALL